eukprot:6049298-Amphidinium_carterae.1
MHQDRPTGHRVRLQISIGAIDAGQYARQRGDLVLKKEGLTTTPQSEMLRPIIVVLHSWGNVAAAFASWMSHLSITLRPARQQHAKTPPESLLSRPTSKYQHHFTATSTRSQNRSSRNRSTITEGGTEARHNKMGWCEIGVLNCTLSYCRLREVWSASKFTSGNGDGTATTTRTKPAKPTMHSYKRRSTGALIEWLLLPLKLGADNSFGITVTLLALVFHLVQTTLGQVTLQQYTLSMSITKRAKRRRGSRKLYVCCLHQTLCMWLTSFPQAFLSLKLTSVPLQMACSRSKSAHSKL